MIEERIFSETETDIYIYDMDTHEYKDKTVTPFDKVLSKIDGINRYYRFNMISTFIKPPDITEDTSVAVFNEETLEWEVKSDNRGASYILNGKTITIDKIGDTIPNNATNIIPRPPKSMIKPQYIDGIWKETALIYHNFIVTTKEQVDSITSSLILQLGENKAKTEKLKAGNDPCPVWDEFISKRDVLIQEGNEFVSNNNLS